MQDLKTNNQLTSNAARELAWVRFANQDRGWGLEDSVGNARCGGVEMWSHTPSIGGQMRWDGRILVGTGRNSMWDGWMGWKEKRLLVFQCEEKVCLMRLHLQQLQNLPSVTSW